MQKFKEFNIEKTLESERICNNCGKSFIFNYDKMQEDPDDIIHPFDAHFGYFSTHDMEHWHFDLCEACLEKIVSRFVVPCQTKTYLI